MCIECTTAMWHFYLRFIETDLYINLTRTYTIQQLMFHVHCSLKRQNWLYMGRLHSLHNTWNSDVVYIAYIDGIK